MSGSQGEKTEKATPKKRRDAREKGQVLKSNDVNSALILVVLFAALKSLWSFTVEQLGRMYVNFLDTDYILTGSERLAESIANLGPIWRDALTWFFVLTGPVLIVALIIGFLANILQVGFLFSTKAMQPKLSRINPIQGFKRIFSARTIAELVKSILKVVCVGYVAYKELMKLIPMFPGIMRLDPLPAFLEVMDITFTAALKMAFVLAILAIFDYLFQWWQYEKDLKMSKQEIKDEHKMIEGNPEIKGKIKEKQREISAMRMMSAVPDADVVITNPTHYAIALKYDEKDNIAPEVIAKGKDHLALKIKKIAKEHKIEIVEDKPLAQSLYIYCELGDVIPEDMYQAVAEILVYVQKVKTGQIIRKHQS